MQKKTVSEKIKLVLDTKVSGISARLFVTREDGITVYDSVQDKTTTSISALVSGVWQASEALMGLVKDETNPQEFRLGFDTSAQGIFLLPFKLEGKRYFLGAIYSDCMNPGHLKRQVSLIKEEMDRLFEAAAPVAKMNTNQDRGEYLFSNITDEEMDRLFSLGGV